MVTAESWDALTLFRHYRNGILPFAGGLLDQPNMYVEIMGHLDLIDGHTSENRHQGG